METTIKRTKPPGLRISPTSNQVTKMGFAEAVIGNIEKQNSGIEDHQSEKLAIINDEDDLSNTDRYKLTAIITDIESHLRNIKYGVYEIGNLLDDAKSILPHGSFERWIEEHFKGELKYPTAYLYMKIYKTFRGSPELVQKMPTTLLLSLSQKSFPDELVKQIKANAESLEIEDIKNVTYAYKQYKDKVINLCQFEKTVNKQIQLGLAISKGLVERRLSNNNRATLRQGVEQLIEAIGRVRNGIDRMEYVFPAVENSEEQKALLTSVEKAISELQGMKDNLDNGKGLFKPAYPQNPMLPIGYNNQNLNN